MSLWGNKDYVTGNNKPLYANTNNVTSTSTIHDSVANTVKYYGVVAGVSATEETTSAGTPQHPTHAGWVSLKVGTGPVVPISPSGGAGVNTAGFLLLTDASVHGTGTGANISFTIANSQNTLESYSSNSQLNVINTITIVDGGSGWSNASDITIDTDSGDYTTLPTFTVVLGGRAGRIQTETLIAMGSITQDDPKDNVYFTGV
jgi:hypothetical protein